MRVAGSLQTGLGSTHVGAFRDFVTICRNFSGWRARNQLEGEITGKTSKFSSGGIEFQVAAVRDRVDEAMPATIAYAPRFRRISELTLAGRQRSRDFRALQARK